MTRRDRTGPAPPDAAARLALDLAADRDRKPDPLAARIVPATGRDLASLQPLAEAVFADAATSAPLATPADLLATPADLLATPADLLRGAHHRDPAWFRRKLAREAVDPILSSLVLGTGDEPVGYMFVGASERATGIVHGAGLGLLPAWRGRGLGPVLVESTARRLQAAGISAVRLLADRHHHTFYRRLGFLEVTQQHTMGAAGTGLVDLDLTAHPPRPWPLPGTPVAQWSAATWERTASRTATLRLTDHAWAHLSREGRAVLVHRLCISADAELAAALHALQAHFTALTPVLLYGCDPVSCVTVTCLAAGWQVLQHAHVMERRFW